MVGPIQTMTSHSILHNSSITMAMDLVIMLQETTPMNVHSSLVLLMERMALVVHWSTPMTTTVMASMTTLTCAQERPCSKQSMPTAALIHSSMTIRMVSQMQTMFVQRQALALRLTRTVAVMSNSCKTAMGMASTTLMTFVRIQL